VTPVGPRTRSGCEMRIHLSAASAGPQLNVELCRITGARAGPRQPDGTKATT